MTLFELLQRKDEFIPYKKTFLVFAASESSLIASADADPQACGIALLLQEVAGIR